MNNYETKDYYDNLNVKRLMRSIGRDSILDRKGISYNMGISSFRGENEIYSNFYKLKTPIIIAGIEFWTTEAAFQAMKSRNKEDWERFAKMTPEKAKKEGRKLFLRENWSLLRIEVMRRLLALKFADPELKQRLIDTGEEMLIEDNSWGDTYWGICNGVGENQLGKLLMELRNKLKEEAEV